MRFSFLLVGSLVVTLFIYSCGEKGEEGNNKGNSDDPPKILSIEQKVKTGVAVRGWKPYTKRDSQIKFDDANSILHGVSRKEFANLDAFVKEFDRRYPDGEPYRVQFYNKFEEYDDYNQVNAGKYHNRYLKNLKAWAEEHGDSGAPAITTAAFEIYLAWYERGGGYADKVTEKGWEGFRKHIGRAREILENAPEAAKKDPHYYSIWITVHLAQGNDFAEVQKQFEAGVGVDPTYVDLYLRMTNFLQPRWYGENVNDWHQWLIAVLRNPLLKEEDRLVLYGDIVRNNIRGSYEDAEKLGTTIYQLYGIDQERYMKGLAACCRSYPGSSDWPSAYLFHAVRAGSESHIKAALELMDKKFAAGIFGGEKEFFVMLSFIEENFPKLVPMLK